MEGVRLPAREAAAWSCEGVLACRSSGSHDDPTGLVKHMCWLTSKQSTRHQASYMHDDPHAAHAHAPPLLAP